MPSSLSLTSPILVFSKTVTLDETVIPWEALSYEKDFEVAKTKGGVFDFSSWGVIEIAGKDAADYLHRMTTLNIKSLAVGAVGPCAFLTGKGGVVSYGYLQRVKEEVFHFIVAPPMLQSSLLHIEKFHFGEQLTVTDQSEAFALLGWWNADTEHLQALELKEEFTVSKVYWRRWQGVSMDIWKDSRMPLLAWMKMPRGSCVPLLNILHRSGVGVLGLRLFHYFRMQAGLPWWGKEVSDKEIILEAGMEDFVSRNKGCYPGQEVVERIFTYGQVNRKLLALHLQGKSQEELPLKLAAGLVVSVEQIPENPESFVALGYIQKNYWNSFPYQEDGITLTPAK